ncbi:Histone H2A.Z-specific chaperone CHZ1 [Aspergillus fumigatus]
MCFWFPLRSSCCYHSITTIISILALYTVLKVLLHFPPKLPFGNLLAIASSCFKRTHFCYLLLLISVLRDTSKRATMGDNHQATLSNDPAANAPDAAAADKGKGKAADEPSLEMSMDEEEDSDESEAEEMMADDDDDDDHDNLEPISEANIISGGRRTRGKTIDFQEAAEKLKAEDEMDDEDDDDEEFQPNDEDMRD